MNTETPPIAPLNPPPTSDQLTEDERTWAAIAHASAFVTLLGIPGFLGPLVVYLIKREQSEFVAAQAKEAINFDLTVLFAILVCVPLVFCFGLGLFLMIPILVAQLVLNVIAAIRASHGERYLYPFTVRLVK